VRAIPNIHFFISMPSRVNVMSNCIFNTIHETDLRTGSVLHFILTLWHTGSLFIMPAVGSSCDTKGMILQIPVRCMRMAVIYLVPVAISAGKEDRR
jgi:hypothetical protein